MEDVGFGGHSYAMGSRIPSIRGRGAMGFGTSTVGSQIPSRAVFGRAATTSQCNDPNLCQKPVGGSMTIPIVLGVCIPVVVAISVLLYLHRRNVKKQQREDAMDPHKSLDFGLAEQAARGSNGKRKSILGREKDHSRFKQMSMDMNLSSPYLLPPELQNSRESLARSLHANEADPYRPVAQYAASDAASIRSRGASIYTPSLASPKTLVPPRPFPRSPTSPEPPARAKSPQELPGESPPRPVAKDAGPAQAELPAEEDVRMPAVPIIQEPPAAAKGGARKPMMSPPHQSPADSAVEMGYENPFEVHEIPGPEQPGLGIADHHQPQQASIHNAPTNPHTPQVAIIEEEPLEYYDYDYPDDQQNVHGQQQHGGHDERGRNMQRQSHMYDENGQQGGGLGVPQQRDTRRLSVGFRPLPPDDIMDSEDPEYRANRIRSFYKEYFDDSGRNDAAPPMPPMPQQHHHQQQQQQQQRGGNDYYEDYDDNYVAEGLPYFDPETNTFVMPYAQPVARRAMTPPPTGQRFAGPKPPRAFHGSLANMNGPRGPRGPPRPDSSVSNAMGPRPGSSVSAAYGRPRAGSTMSGGRFGGAPRKPMPPPAPLNTLPNPSKLKDDSFALLGSIEFAPPESFADRARGRSQSPAGERRPYKVNMPAHSPLVNAFEELPVLPSPHLLRKSATFTALDFAPPRKFTEGGDARSETGSIRSNRSGTSAVALAAVRNGAGRVSRLPGDTVFTQSAMQQTLKPSWNMRD
ncbi:hypothetical protein QBC46DRAFT_34196 [Diplogelasinospora grovesii]|uniref:Uncharacterized protein n=1 Tax=Diplogelasinospora grovesii TaxID=303347 RepID=A0AAN6NEA8_9PEZI|nr:hypothetical protein QBC46DRAFT_34196 [Diplogelasinospora grovesii]